VRIFQFISGALFLALWPVAAPGQLPIDDPGVLAQRSLAGAAATLGLSQFQPQPSADPWSKEMRLGRMTLRLTPWTVQGNADGVSGWMQRESLSALSLRSGAATGRAWQPGAGQLLTNFAGIFHRRATTVSDRSPVVQKEGLLAKTLNEIFTWQSRIHISNEKAPVRASASMSLSVSSLLGAHSSALPRHGSSFFSKAVSQMLEFQ
jgi:hypothetical protein